MPVSRIGSVSSLPFPIGEVATASQCQVHSALESLLGSIPVGATHRPKAPVPHSPDPELLRIESSKGVCGGVWWVLEGRLWRKSGREPPRLPGPSLLRIFPSVREQLCFSFFLALQWAALRIPHMSVYVHRLIHTETHTHILSSTHSPPRNEQHISRHTSVFKVR